MAALISHAQNFEDVMLWRALGHVAAGRYVDIGAQDPVVDSVSLLFFEHGWRGTHVDASPEYAQRLRESRPGETVIQAAVAAKAGTLAFFEIPGTGLGTGDAAIAKKHAKAGFEAREIVVPALTLDDVLEREGAGDIHWLKIDVEGGEKAALQGWKASPARPWIVVVESTLPLSQTPSHKAWEKLVLAKGYKFAYFDGLNRFYVSDRHPQLRKAFETGPNVFDGFSIGPDASAPYAAVLNDRRRAAEEELARVRRETEVALAGKDREHTHQWQVREQEFDKERQWLGNERVVLSDRLAAAERSALEAAQALARHEEQAAARAAAQSDGAARLAQALADRQRELDERLRAVQDESLAATRRLAEREQEAGTKVAALEAAARERVQEAEARIAAVQAAAAQHEAEVGARLRAREAEVQHLESALREREGVLQAALEAAKSDARAAAEALASRERELAAHLAAKEAEIARANQVLAAREAAHEVLLRESQQEARDAYARLVERERENGAQLKAQHDAARANEESLRDGLRASEAERAQVEESLLGQVALLRREAKETAAAHAARIEALEAEVAAHAGEIERRELARRKIADRLEALADYAHGEARLQSSMLEALRQAMVEWRSGGEPESLPKWEPLFDEPPQRMAPAPDAATLLALDGRAFIECAYTTLLQRRPDRTGLAYYFGRLVSGYPKIHLLAQIANSKEGHAAAAQLPGLREAIDAYRRRNAPLLGALIGDAGETNDALSRRLRATEQALAALERRGSAGSAASGRSIADMRQINDEVVAQSQQAPAPPREPARLGEWPERTRAIYARLRRESNARFPEAA